MQRVLEIAGILLLTATFAVFSSELAAQHEHDEHEHDEHAVDEEEHLDEVTLSKEAIELFNVRVEKVELRSLTGTATVPARVSFNAEAMAYVGTQVQGRVVRIAARLGDEVSQGDLLLVVDSPELGAAQSNFVERDATVDAAKTSIEAAEAMVDVARTAFERAEILRESGGISITDYLERQGALREAEANTRRAEAEHKVAQAARQAAENQLHIYGYRHEDCAALLETGEIITHYEIHAPISGRVIERKVTPGEVVDPAKDALMVLADMEELWVLADVPERHASRVAIGTPARITMGALGGMTFEGTVSYIAPHLDARTRTASVRVVVKSGSFPQGASDANEAEDEHGHEHEHEHENEHEHEEQIEVGAVLKPGMFGQAELSLAPLPGQSTTQVIAVPEHAIQDIEGGPAVFVPVEDEPNTFALRPVRIGQRVGRWVPILSGLHDGDSYVVNNTFLLKAELGKGGASHGHAH